MSQQEHGGLDLDRLSEQEIDTLPFGVIGVDGAGIVRLHSRGASSITGLRPEEALGRDLFRDVAPSTNQPGFRGRFQDGVRQDRLDAQFQFVLTSGPAPLRVRVEMGRSRLPDRYWITIHRVEALHRPSPAALPWLTSAEGHPSADDDAVCSREPIHIPGTVQPGALLLVVDHGEGRIVAASDNADDLFPDGAAAMLGRPASDRLPDPAMAALAAMAHAPRGGTQCVQLPLGTPPRPFHVIIHAPHAGRQLVELEPISGLTTDDTPAPDRIQSAVRRLREADTLLSLSQILVDEVRALTGFERVVVYQFDEDWNGESIAEARTPDWTQSLLGLRFPAADIPTQARALYLHSPSRFVTDRDYVPVPLLAPAETVPVDLTFARFRALSPIHLQYQRNLGVNGSMSASILDRGRLWGLLIGHHRQPHYVPPGMRTTVTTLTEVFALRLHELESTESWREQRGHLEVQTRLLHQMASEESWVSALTNGPATMAGLFGATGAAVVSGGSVAAVGQTPTAEQIRALAAWLRRQPQGLATAHLCGRYPPAAAYASVASGLLALPVDEAKEHLLLWFRPEVVSSVAWGGDPNQAGDRDGPAVLPRRSFERWVEHRRGWSVPWRPWHSDIAGSLANAIAGVILRHRRQIQQMSAERRRLAAALAESERLLRHKDLLVREIDHRVNNSLQIVASFLQLQAMTLSDPDAARALAEAHGRLMGVSRVHQSLYLSDDVESVDLGQTLQSLARDMGPLAGPGQAIRVHSDPGVMVASRIGVALALITTELVTNALKHAYAPGEPGDIMVQVTRRLGGGLTLTVADQGRGLGPKVPDLAGQKPGLGMRIVKALTDQIRATLTSDAGNGARFIVDVPGGA